MQPERGGWRANLGVTVEICLLCVSKCVCMREREGKGSLKESFSSWPLISMKTW